MMDRDFFIKLVFGTHKVADLLNQEGKDGKALKSASNNLLADLLLICEENPVTLEQKKNVLPRTLRGIGEVQRILNLVKEGSKVNSTNFAILEQEYKKVPDILVEFFAERKTNLSVRQEKILEFLKGKEKAQVWELQKMLPEPVTKRTLRRDMDYLMQQGKVERQGEWNGVFYKLTR